MSSTGSLTMSSAIRRLLDEISWEGNASKYRDGGLGKETVLTAEVLQALDFLPREAFLGQVLRMAHGADLARAHASSDAEHLVFDVLPAISSCRSLPCVLNLTHYFAPSTASCSSKRKGSGPQHSRTSSSPGNFS